MIIDEKKSICLNFILQLFISIVIFMALELFSYKSLFNDMKAPCSRNTWFIILIIICIVFAAMATLIEYVEDYTFDLDCPISSFLSLTVCLLIFAFEVFTMGLLIAFFVWLYSVGLISTFIFFTLVCLLGGGEFIIIIIV
jgi:hypothetical protein